MLGIVDIVDANTLAILCDLVREIRVGAIPALNCADVRQLSFDRVQEGAVTADDRVVEGIDEGEHDVCGVVGGVLLDTLSMPHFPMSANSFLPIFSLGGHPQAP